jgi:hypothetical protein
MNAVNETPGSGIHGARQNFELAKNNNPQSGNAFNSKPRFLVAPLLPDIARRRISEQLCKASEFLKRGDLDNCRIAIAVGMEWADYLHHNRRRRA